MREKLHGRGGEGYTELGATGREINGYCGCDLIKDNNVVFVGLHNNRPLSHGLLTKGKKERKNATILRIWSKTLHNSDQGMEMW